MPVRWEGELPPEYVGKKKGAAKKLRDPYAKKKKYPRRKKRSR